MNRSRLAVVSLSILFGVVLGWQLHAMLTPPPAAATPPRTFETLATDDGRKVFVGGRWYPLVQSTKATLVELIPPTLTPGEVAHLNADGTVLITSHTEAAKRQSMGGGAWPPSPD